MNESLPVPESRDAPEASASLDAPTPEDVLPDGPVQHPRADRAYALGLLSFIGVVFVLPALLGPYAWYLAVRTRREIDREPARWRGRGQATAGAWLGAAATALVTSLVIAVVLLALWRQVELGLDTGYG